MVGLYVNIFWWVNMLLILENYHPWDLNMALWSKEDCTTYSHTINIHDDASTTYAAIFHKNHLTNEILADTTVNNLCQLGIRIFGDIKTIFHHAKANTPANTTTSPTTITTFMKMPAAKPRIILHHMTQSQFRKFWIDWNVFKRITNLPDNQIHAQLYNSCNETVQNNLLNTTTDFFSLT